MTAKVPPGVQPIMQPIMPPIGQRTISVEPRPGGIYAGRFLAMGCPCEILAAAPDIKTAQALARRGADEAWRIERKFSRYRGDSVVAAINASAGRAVRIDAETRRLLDYAAHCHALSDGLFDVTSGVLRRAWTFDGTDRIPDAAAIDALRARVGFGRLRCDGDTVALPVGMEIDLGGIAKEYAVDRALAALQDARLPVLVNFGGDLCTDAAPAAQPWQVGVESTVAGAPPAMVLELSAGALATSGDAHRYVERQGVRYGHILDPRSGWPVVGAPRSVTVAAATCVEAGTLSTIAYLQGSGAEAFLDEMGVRYWCIR
jgi:thiamine biosynthesis lipoprotein